MVQPASKRLVTEQNLTIAVTAGIAPTKAIVDTGRLSQSALDAAYAASGGSAAGEQIAAAQVFAGLVPRRRMEAPPVRALGKFLGRGSPTVTAGGSGYAVNDEITLAAGAGETGTIVRVTAVNSTAVLSAATVMTGRYLVAPANPMVQASTTGAGTGATFGMSNSSPGGIKGAVSIAAGDDRFKFTGPGVKTNLSSSGYYGSSVSNAVHHFWDFATDAPMLELKFVGANSRFVLYIDGQQVWAPQLETDASGAPYLLTLAHGGTQRMRNYRIVGFNLRFGGIAFGATDTLQAATTDPRPLLWMLGDSYTQSVGAENPATQANQVMADQLGIDLLADGVGGSGWTTATPNSPLERINTRLAVLSQAPNFIGWDLGYNNGSGAPGNLAAVETAMRACIARAKELYPTAKHVAFGPATPAGETAGLIALKDRMASVYTELGIPFIDVANWVNADNKALYTGSDQVHPSPLGHKYLGARRAAAAAPILGA